MVDDVGMVRVVLDVLVVFLLEVVDVVDVVFLLEVVLVEEVFEDEVEDLCRRSG